MSADRAIETRLSGWGNFPWARCRVYRPEKRSTLRDHLASDRERHWIARGLGRSYGDTALNAGGGVIDFTRLDRFLSWDPDQGILECEAGVSLEDILEVFVPRGWFLSVTPGTKFVTVGGAIANDVHGKNHHCDGTFGCFVESLRLLVPSGDEIECSREREPEVFRATLGGIGLTGMILSARLRLRRIETSSIMMDVKRLGDLEETMLAVEASESEYPYSVAWIDCLASGASLGRSVLLLGRHATRDQLPAGHGDPLAVHRDGKLLVPFQFPGLALNRFSVRAFNHVYYEAHPDRFDHLVDYDQFYYPLDSIHHWNRIYGRRGFVQYQVALPPETSREGLVVLLEKLSATGRASFLAVLKRFGEEGEGYFSFPRSGWTLSLDIPRSRGLLGFLEELDREVLDRGGRFYLGKDAVMSAAALRQGYPQVREFREVRERLDPEGRISSSMGRRLGLSPA